MGRPIPFRVLSIVGVGLFATIGVVAARASAARPGRLAPRDSTFDLVVNTGVTLIIDTTSATLTDSHGQVLTFAGGDIFLDSLEVKNGGLILGQGPNPLRFFVNNSVKIGGSIRVNGQGCQGCEHAAHGGRPPSVRRQGHVQRRRRRNGQPRHHPVERERWEWLRREERRRSRREGWRVVAGSREHDPTADALLRGRGLPSRRRRRRLVRHDRRGGIRWYERSIRYGRMQGRRRKERRRSHTSSPRRRGGRARLHQQ